MSARGAQPAGVALVLLLAACIAEEPAAYGLSERSSSAGAPPVAAAAETRTDSRRLRLLEFLRGQGGSLAQLDDAGLDGLSTVRLNRDYTGEELALLADLPSLREVTIWRDGEGPPGSEGAPAPTDDDLRVLGGLEQVETLRLGGWSAPFTDAGVAQLEKLPALEHLHLIQAMSITDASMKSVARLPALETLNITYTRVSDQGLAHLLESGSLKSVRYGWARDSRRWLAEFRRLHPDAAFTIE